MGEGIGWLGLAASLVLVVVTLVLSWWRRLDLHRDVLIATIRALVQLLAVGSALAIVIDPEQPLILAWLWVVGMVGFASWTVGNRAPEVPRLAVLALPALVASTGLTVAVIFGLGIFDLEGRTLIPLAGMMVGNSMTATVVAARRLVTEMAEKRPEIEARLALAQPWPVASRPYVRSAMRTALTSQIETTKAVGLVFLPGAMTGLILAGVDPVDAVLVQAAIMFLILGATATNVVIIGESVTRQLFTADHRLVHLARPTG